MDTTTFAVLDASDTITEVHELTDAQRDELVRRHGDRLVYLPMGGEVGDTVEVDDDGEARVVEYEVRLSGGRAARYRSYAAALEAAREAGASEIGHSGDLTDGGDRTLCWADVDAADNDDGEHAMAEIVRT